MNTRRLILALLAGIALAAPARHANACGPFFPATYLVEGHEGRVLWMPAGDFEVELTRILGHGPRTESAAGGWKITLEADVKDLEVALRGASTSSTMSGDATVADYRQMREAMKRETDGDDYDVSIYQRIHEKRRQGFSLSAYPSLFARIPPEFALYVRGAAAYRLDDFPGAIAAWNQLLALPSGQRRLRSTWAAFMIGKAYLYLDPPKSIPYFEQTRALAQAGFADSMGLAVSSLGWQAKAEYSAGDLSASLRHYYEAAGTGTGASSDWQSLQSVCEAILRRPAIDPSLVQDPVTRKLLTACAITLSNPAPWLNAMQSADSKLEPRECDQLAWAAYQSGRFDQARRWLKLAAEHTPAGHWVAAKLLMRDGKIDEALKELDLAAGKFSGAESWQVTEDLYYNSQTPNDMINAERGTLRLGRKEYVAALDAFARSDYWEDAAYLAERVLTIKELERFIEQRKDDAELKARQAEGWNGTSMSRLDQLDYLLARRLARAKQWQRASPHFPAQYRTAFEDLARQVQAAAGDAPSRARAEAFYKAGWIEREQGMELLGTENEPDWRIYDGDFDPWPGATKARRLKKDDQITTDTRNAALVGAISATRDELDRLDLHSVEPEKRFHYRYTASGSMWSAARLLPNNDALTAAALYWGGIWHAVRDEKYADRFYQALVRRCSKLPIGQEADKKHWFPAQPPALPPKLTEIK